ncbi:hypothetical protein [Streptomyces mangrovisoli]|uniref:Uncharacterized protein n=1 Tax=Streptomyces mangrovisoli TaxID=1428628 RepID=A0A1J4NMP7_9ACTN|nr:hypothetical protein [Streptomyces mangrovisoli]OIJ63615.1 hypothetical protein WN71_032860 [Streptomyces mangrovisoli]
MALPDPAGHDDYEELDDDFATWAGPPRGIHHPDQEDVTEEQALPPQGPAGVSTTADGAGDTSSQ